MPEPYLVSRELEKVERKVARERIPKAFSYSAKPGLFDNSVYAYEPGAWAEPEKKRRDPDEIRPKPFRPPPKNSQYIKEAINPVGRDRGRARGRGRGCARDWPVCVYFIHTLTSFPLHLSIGVRVPYQRLTCPEALRREHLRSPAAAAAELSVEAITWSAVPWNFCVRRSAGG